MKEIIVVIAVILFIIFAGCILDAEQCANRSVSFEDHEYKILGGCMVKHKGRWLPLENIRGFDDK